MQSPHPWDPPLENEQSWKEAPRLTDGQINSLEAAGNTAGGTQTTPLSKRKQTMCIQNFGSRYKQGRYRNLLLQSTEKK